MIIEISENFRVKTIPLNFVLEERVEADATRKIKPKCSHKWVIRGYYSGLSAALAAIPDYLAQSPAIKTLGDYTRAWDALRKEVAVGFSK